MKPLSQLLVDLPVKKILGSMHLSVKTLCFDSRKAATGSCFIAIKGSQVDGHTYIPMAIAAGSRVIVCEHLPESIEEAVTYVVVSSAVNALGMMAAHFYGHPSKQLKVVAVTGTNGKTTVVHLLYNMVMRMGYKAGMLSTIYNKVVDQTHPASHTTPDGLQIQALLHLMVTAGCQYCFMEASSHAIFQERLAGLHLTGAIFTNITHDHLDYHLDFARYIQAKKKLFDDLPSTAFALLNQEDRNSTIMVQNCKANCFTFSLRDSADFRAKHISHTLDGLELQVEQQSVWFQLLGAFNASNLLAAYGAAQLLGLPSQESLVALSAIPPILGRMNKVNYRLSAKSAYAEEFARSMERWNRSVPSVREDLSTGSTSKLPAEIAFCRKSHAKPQHVIIDYAHTPDAVQKVIQTLRAILPMGSRLITIMGCGGNRDQQKRAIIGKILSEHSDIAIFTSDNPRDEDPKEIIQAMQQGVSKSALKKVLHIVDRAMAIQTACQMAQANDLILIAGKGHQYYEEIDGVKHFFCEEKIVQGVLGEGNVFGL